MTVLRYTRGDELEPVAITWYEPDGTLYDFSSGWTFRARIGNGSGFLVEKTSGFTGAATSPNLQLNFTAGELDGIGAGTYHLDVQATLTATSQTITRTWLFQILAGVGTDTLPQNPTGLGVLGDLSVDGDLTMPAATLSGGAATTGVVRGHTFQAPWTYTLTNVPADVSVGTALHVPVAVTVNNTNGVGPQFQTGNFGPRGIINVEGLARYAQNMTAFGFAPVGLSDQLTLANNAGVARTLVPAWSHLSARSVIADGATCTLAANDTAQGGAAFVDTPVYGSMNGGTLNGTTNNHEIIHFLAGGGLVGNTTMQRRVAFDVKAFVSSGGTAHWDVPGTIDTDTSTLAEEIGLRVQKFTKGTTKLGIVTAHPIRLMSEDLTHPELLTLIQTSSTRTFTLTGTNPTIQAFDFSPTIVWEDNAGLFGMGQLFQAAPILKNATGEARSLGTLAGFYTFNSNPTIRADDAAVTVPSIYAFRDAPIFDRLVSGTLAVTEVTGLKSEPSVGAGVTVTTRRGLEVRDPGSTGTITTNIGVDIVALTRGGTNIGVRNASAEVATPSVQTLTAVGNTITPNAKVKRLDNTSGGSLTLTSNPHISDGQDGQILILFNSSANDVVLTDGNGVQLGAATRTIGQRDTLMLLYSTTIGDWIELGFVNN